MDIISPYPEQEISIADMKRMESFGHGGIDISDVGLGKTPTMAFHLERSKFSTRPTDLIVGPCHLIEQWKNELVRVRRSHLHQNPDCGLSEEVRILVYADTVAKRKAALYSGVPALDSEEPMEGAYDYVLVSYPILRSDIIDICSRKWGRTVLDEVHQIRNGFGSKASQTARAAFRLNECSVYRWGLSATPIHNKLIDLCSIACYIGLEPYSERAWWKRPLTTNPEEKWTRAETKFRQDLAAWKSKFTTQRVRDRKGLAEPEINVIEIYPTEQEVEVVTILRESMKNKWDEFKVAVGAIKARLASELLALITRLRQCSASYHCLKEELPEPENIMETSSKAVAIAERIIQTFESGEDDRFVLFSNFPDFLRIVERTIHHMRPNMSKFHIFTGETNKKARSNIIAEFQSESTEFQILGISLLAGNSGLNLPRCHTVAIADPYFTEVVEQQAIGRVDRITQTKEVKVYRFIMKNSIEEWMVALKQKKLLTSSIAGFASAEAVNADFSLSELEVLFSRLVKFGTKEEIEEREEQIKKEAERKEEERQKKILKKFEEYNDIENEMYIASPEKKREEKKREEKKREEKKKLAEEKKRAREEKKKLAEKKREERKRAREEKKKLAEERKRAREEKKKLAEKKREEKKFAAE